MGGISSMIPGEYTFISTTIGPAKCPISLYASTYWRIKSISVWHFGAGYWKKTGYSAVRAAIKNSYFKNSCRTNTQDPSMYLRLQKQKIGNLFSVFTTHTEQSVRVVCLLSFWDFIQ